MPTNRPIRLPASRTAFTLIEVMIVIAIVLALTGLVGVAMFGQRNKANIQQTQVQLSNLRRAIDNFRLDFDRPPTEEEGIEVLWDKELLDANADATKYVQGGYLDKKLERDRWGSPWGYEVNLDQDTNLPSFRLWSNGPDGQEATEDDIVEDPTVNDDNRDSPSTGSSDRGLGG